MQQLRYLLQEIDKAITYTRYSKAKQLIKRGISLSKRLDKLDYYFYFSGELALMNDDLDRAVEYFLLAISQNILFKDAYNELANTLVELGYLPEALLYINIALYIDNSYPILYNTKGWILKELDRLPQALYYFNKAISLDNDFLVAYINRADVLSKLSCRKELLAKAYKDALEIAYKKEEPICIRYIINKLRSIC